MVTQGKEGITMKEARPDTADKRNREISFNTTILPLGIDSYFI